MSRIKDMGKGSGRWVAARTDRLVTSLRASKRAQWWATFLFAAAIGCSWMLATPIFGAPDENAHAVRAASVARGQVLGRDHGEHKPLIVDAPLNFKRAGERIACFAFQRDAPADCASFRGPSRLVPVEAAAGRHPPAYYAIDGVPSLLFPSAFGIYLMRLISVLITAAFIATSLLAIRRVAAPRWAGIGLLVAATPMVWFVSGTINPSAPEIAAAIALWTCGAVLVHEAPREVDSRLVASVGIAASVLALSRQLSPLWLLITGVALAIVGGMAALRALWRTRRARIWAAVVGACTLAQVVWVVIVKPLDAQLNSNEAIPGLTTQLAARMSFGETFGRLKEMIGWFGWLDTPPPSFTVFAWIAVLGAIALVAVFLAPRRHVAIAGVLTAIVVLVPIIAETREADTAGFFWQGRYTLPLAVGVPILLALGAATSSEVKRIPPRAYWILGSSLVIGHIAAFGQALRRNTVGYDGTLRFAFDAKWAPPLPAWFLLFGSTAAIIAFAVWILAPGADGRIAAPAAQPADPEPATRSGSPRYS